MKSIKMFYEKYGFVLIIVGGIVVWFCYNIISKTISRKLEDKRYGLNWNPVREKIGIPLIDSDMIKDKYRGGFMWINKTRKENTVKPIHSDKYIIIHDDNTAVEVDRFFNPKRDFYIETMHDYHRDSLNFNEKKAELVFPIKDNLVDKKNINYSEALDTLRVWALSFD